MKTGSDDRRMLIIAGGVFVLLVAVMAFLTPAEDEDIDYPSTYSAASGGGKAAYLTLKQSGYNVERWVRPPQELPPGPDVVLILALPFPRMDKPEREALQRFLAKGGHIVAVGASAAMMLPRQGAVLPANGKACPT